MLSNTLRPNLCYLKIICILHPLYHPKIIGYILKKSKRRVAFVFLRLILMKMKMEMKNRSHRYNIGIGLGIGMNIVNIKSGLV